MSVRPYSIHVSDEDLDDLKHRLARTRWPVQLEGASWEYGANLDFVRDVCNYWQNEYDWRAAENQLNRHPGFLCEVDGVDIHFWHVRSTRRDALPLLLIHGWPGSIVEFDRLIEPLTAPPEGEPAFDVIVPSLPGFGFSGKPRDRGWSPIRIADAFTTLMTQELGYLRFGVQGGDWGSSIGSRIAHRHPENVAALHLNFFNGPPPEILSAEEQALLDRRNAFMARETGYSNVQGTKPDSLTLAQSDSPAGLAAWVLEKFHGWSDQRGDLLSVFDRDMLLTNLMFYWAPNSAASAARIYYESRHDPAGPLVERIEVPTGIASFPGEPWRVPRSWIEPRYNVQRFTEIERGGHFAALENPEGLLREIRAFFAGYAEAAG